MKKVSLAILAAATMMSGAVLADNHTVSLGYAQSDFENLGDIRGVNVQYRYEWDSPLSVMGSFTYMSGDTHEAEDDGESDIFKLKDEVKYYSLLVGPAYRVNEYVSVYALGGVSYTKLNEDTTWIDSNGPFYHESESDNSTAFAWGAGLQFNPTGNISVGIGYEGTTAKYIHSHSINGFNLTVGYRF
jgi:putative virulence related protein PagC